MKNLLIVGFSNRVKDVYMPIISQTDFNLRAVYNRNRAKVKLEDNKIEIYDDFNSIPFNEFDIALVSLKGNLHFTFSKVLIENNVNILVDTPLSYLPWNVYVLLNLADKLNVNLIVLEDLPYRQDYLNIDLQKIDTISNFGFGFYYHFFSFLFKELENNTPKSICRKANSIITTFENGLIYNDYLYLRNSENKKVEFIAKGFIKYSLDNSNSSHNIEEKIKISRKLFMSFNTKDSYEEIYEVYKFWFVFKVLEKIRLNLKFKYFHVSRIIDFISSLTYFYYQIKIFKKRFSCEDTYKKRKL